MLYKFNYEDAEGEEATILMPQVQVDNLEIYFICIPFRSNYCTQKFP